MFTYLLCFLRTVQVAFRAEELVDYSHRQYKTEEGRRITAMEAFNVAKKSLKELKI